MKQLFLLIALVVVTTSLTYGQITKANTTEQNKNPSTANSSVEQEIKRILNERKDAFLPSGTTDYKDVINWEEKYMNKDAITTDTINRVFTGEEKISIDKKEGVLTKGLKLNSIAVDSEKIHVFGETAVANYRWVVTGEFNNQQITDASLFTSVFAKRNGKWQLIAEHISHVPDTEQKTSTTGKAQ